MLCDPNISHVSPEQSCLHHFIKSSNIFCWAPVLFFPRPNQALQKLMLLEDPHEAGTQEKKKLTCNDVLVVQVLAAAWSYRSNLTLTSLLDT